MTSFAAAMDRDANTQVLTTPFPFKAIKTMTFAGATTNDPGDFDGTGNPATLFTVTGDVMAWVFAVVTTATTVAAGATIAVGTTNNTGGIMPSTGTANILATNLAANRVWLPDLSTADTNPGNETLATYVTCNVIANGLDIIQTVGVANINTGVLEYYCLWRPLSSDGNIVAA